MAEAFNIGDVVRLKSGGPSMTIINQIGDGILVCEWFGDTNSVPKRHSFSLETVYQPE